VPITYYYSSTAGFENSTMCSSINHRSSLGSTEDAEATLLWNYNRKENF
jgi:hypothetical protein